MRIVYTKEALDDITYLRRFLERRSVVAAKRKIRNLF